MPRVQANGIEIEYETFGRRSARPLVLIMGLGAQMILWDEEFCEALAARDFFVVRFDNRDVGLSTKLDDAGVPNVFAAIQAAAAGAGVDAPYTLNDMADDTLCLMAALDIDRAHVVGASMGGMIAQVFAARHQVRTKTLAVIFSSNNQPMLPPPGTKQLLAILQKPKDATREALIENAIRVTRITGSPAYPAPAQRIRDETIEGLERSYYPAGVGRHFAAILGSGSLLGYDRQISVPTVVIHGKADRLMRPFGGRAIARAIKGARLVLFDGMGHDLPRELWDDIVGELKTTFAEAW